MKTIDYKYENRFILHRSFRYVFPPMLGMVFAQIAPLVDGICVANAMEEEALSAIGTVGPVNYVFNIIAALGGIGCGVMISRCSGSGERAKAARIFTRTLIFLIISSVILSVAGIIFIHPILRALCATAENYHFAHDYLLVILAGSVFQVLNFAGDYILANDNNQNLAMAGDITGAVVNMIIDVVGVFVLHQGIWIVAFGTAFGSFCCVLVYLLHFRKKDRLCRIVLPKRVPGEENLLKILKPGDAEAVIYCMYAAQLLIQNYVLRGTGGTMGISNSTVIENLQLVFTIVIAGATDAIYPMAAAYDGEQNESGMLMVKRMLARFGFVMLVPFSVILCIFPQLMIMPYGIDEPIMLKTLPFAIRLVSVGSLITLIGTLLVDYLSASEKEGKATLALFIQSAFTIGFMLVLDDYCDMDAPWYAMIIGGVASLIYLWFFCDHLPEGIVRFHQKNLLLLTGGDLDAARVESWKQELSGILTDEETELVNEKLFMPLMSSLPEGVAPHGTFSVLQRDDGRRSVIVRYESKEDYIGANPDIPEQDEEETEFLPDVCIRSEFLGARRLMIVLGGEEADAGVDSEAAESESGQ